jgi:hypothetical protein
LYDIIGVVKKQISSSYWKVKPSVRRRHPSLSSDFRPVALRPKLSFFELHNQVNNFTKKESFGRDYFVVNRNIKEINLSIVQRAKNYFL